MMRRLRQGGFKFDFIGRTRLWFILSGAVILVSVGSLAVRGVNAGLEFRGGTAFQFQSRSEGLSVAELRSVVDEVGVEEATVQEVGSGGFLVQSEHLPEEVQNRVVGVLAEAGEIDRADLNVTDVGPKWGAQITSKALRALVFFLLFVVVYLSIRLEPKMAVASIAAVLHDLVVTAGVYSLAGFVVTPATVIALLTILGYSLYDTVVIFDRVKERTAALSAAGRVTYSQAVNEALNQVFTRSIGTSVTALIPVGSLLFVGSLLLGAETLRELALALFVGMAVGAYSSTFTAAPIVALWKEREERWKTLRTRINARGAVDAPVPPPPPPPPPTQPSRSTAGQTAIDSPPRPASSPTGGGANRPRRRKKRKRRRR